MSSDHFPPRRPLFPSDIEPIQLYRSEEVLAADVQRCVDLGWQVVSLDAAMWDDAAAMHDRLQIAFRFPDYYGSNLDALNDVMFDLVEGRLGFPPDIPGAVIVLTGFTRFLTVAPKQAAALVEILAGTTTGALRYGWPLAVMVQSEDPELHLGNGASTTIPWNPAERTKPYRRF